MKKRDYLFVAALILLDQLTKFYISHNFELYRKHEIIHDFFYITYARNTGAAWSFGEGMGILFVIIAVLMCLAIIWYLYHNKNIKWYYRIIMLLILAGGIGNAIDRIVSGSVIDFLDFYIFGYDFPIFNIADCCITIAMIGMIVTLFADKE